MKSFLEHPLKVGKGVIVQGIKCYVSYCPFEKNDYLGWLFICPKENIIRWVQIIGTDQYQEIKKDQE